MGFLEVLTLVFVTLKLTDVIEWSWVWVLSPLIVSGSIYIFLLLSMIFIARK